MAQGSSERASCVGEIRSICILAMVGHFSGFLFKSVFQWQRLSSRSICIAIFVRFACFNGRFFFNRITFMTSRKEFRPAGFTNFCFNNCVDFTTAIISRGSDYRIKAFATLDRGFNCFNYGLLFCLFKGNFSICRDRVFEMFVNSERGWGGWLGSPGKLLFLSKCGGGENSV